MYKIDTPGIKAVGARLIVLMRFMQTGQPSEIMSGEDVSF
jgi:hypothetical protein